MAPWSSVFSLLTTFLAAHAMAAPFIQPKVVTREIGPRFPDALETIPVYIEPDNLARHEEAGLTERRIPAEVVTTSVDGVIKVYGTRDEEELNARQIPTEVATTAEDGVIKVYGSREVAEDFAGRQNETEEVPTRALDWVYDSREIAEDSIELVGRQDVIPAEVATTSVGGVIKVYDGAFW